MLPSVSARIFAKHVLDPLDILSEASRTITKRMGTEDHRAAMLDQLADHFVAHRQRTMAHITVEATPRRGIQDRLRRIVIEVCVDSVHIFDLRPPHYPKGVLEHPDAVLVESIDASLAGNKRDVIHAIGGVEA